jgi:hypothetical protein
MTEGKRSRTFQDCDDVAGWNESDRDERLWKYIRPHDKKVADIPMTEAFEFVKAVILPPILMVDPFEVEKQTTVDRGDIYEAFWRTSNVSIRGIFANGEPTWGTAEYRNGMSYTGMFKGCVPDGFGEKRAGASVFKGRFKEGMRHGRGLFLDASHFRLYVGTFRNDQPHGAHLCIHYKWASNHKRVTHTRTSLLFDDGTLTKCEKNTMANVSSLSGLLYEEFFKYYREGEKAMEDFVARQRLADIGADGFLWQPVRCELYAKSVEEDISSTNLNIQYGKNTI